MDPEDPKQTLEDDDVGQEEAGPSRKRSRAVLEDEEPAPGGEGEEDDEDEDEDFEGEGSEGDEEEDEEEEEGAGRGEGGARASPGGEEAAGGEEGEEGGEGADGVGRRRKKKKKKDKKKRRLEKKRRQEKKRRRAGGLVDDAADDDDDDDEDGQRQRRRAARAFFEDIAEVTDEDEDDEEEEEGFEEGFIAEAGEEEQAEEPGEHARLARELAERERKEGRARGDKRDRMMPDFLRDRLAGLEDGDRLDADEEERLNAELRQRYMGMAQDAGEGDEETAVGQQALLPNPATDPKLWTIRCRPGRERETLVLIMNKANYCRKQNTPLQIQSVFCREDVKGYIYLEAHKVSHVKDAVRDVPNLLLGQGIKVVPLADMVPAVTPGEGRAAAQVAPGDWARLKTGAYKSDLCRVMEVDPVGGRSLVRLVPRVDLPEVARKERERARGEKAERGANLRGAKVRPTARGFSEEEARELGLLVAFRDLSVGRVAEVSGMQFQDGYLLKRVAIGSLIREESPSLEEVRRFQSASREEAEGGDGLEGLTGGKKGKQQEADAYEKGDRIVVTSGDLKGVTGTVLGVRQGGQVDVKPALGELGDLLTFPPSQLAKYWEAGDAVRVARGEHEGMLGDVVRVVAGEGGPTSQGTTCVVFNLELGKEVEVLAKDLARAAVSDNRPQADSFGPYHLFDLVVLDQATVGVVVQVERTHCRVLTNGGTPEAPDLRTCTLADIKRRLASAGRGQPAAQRRDQFAQDMYRSPVAVGDSVTITKGPGEGRTGQVRFIHKGSLFLQSRDLLLNGGYFCVKSFNTRVKGGLGGMAGAAGGAGGLGSSAAAQAALQAGSVRGGAAGAGPRVVAVGGRRDPMVGKKVTIDRGPYRGYRGIIKDVLEDAFVVELESQYKNVTVSKAMIDGQTGALPPVTGRGGLPTGATPGIGRAAMGFTPGHAAFTPAHQAFTPAHAAFTPAHQAFTPAHPGAYTPAHPGAATPAHPGAATPRFNVPREPGEGAAAAGAAGVGPGRLLETPADLEHLRGLLVHVAFGGRNVTGSVINVEPRSSILQVQSGTWVVAGPNRSLAVRDEDEATWVPLAQVVMAPVSKGDTVRIFTGKDKGEEGKIITVDSVSASCVVVLARSNRTTVVNTAQLGTVAPTSKVFA